MDKILVIFEENKQYTKENITNFISLKRKETIVTTYDELKNKVSDINLKDFESILDCTYEHKLYNKNKDKGVELRKDGLEYLQLNDRNVIVCKGPNLSQLSTSQSTVIAIREKFKEDFELYNKAIDFLIKKNPNIRNKSSFQEATEQGMELNSCIKTNTKKRYVFVYKLPEIKEPNTEYILPENSKMLKMLKEAIDEVIFF